MKKITSKQVKAFAKKYSKTMGVRIIESGTVMWVLSKLLRRVCDKYADIIDKIDDLLRPMALVRAIFLTFRVGSNKTDYVYQIETIVHEVIHCIRIRKWVEDGGKALGWYKEYFSLVNPRFRAIEEAICHACAGEITRALTGGAPSFEDLDLSGSYYVFKDADIEAAHEAYKLHLNSVGYTSSVVREAAIILKSVGIL